jgi:two-component system, OmpR family, sensor histidine kinase SenX3
MSEQTDTDVVAKQLREVLARLGADSSSHDVTALLDELDRVSGDVAERLSIAGGERRALVNGMGLVCEGVVLADASGNIVHVDELGDRWLADETGNSMAGEALTQVLRVASEGRQTTRSLELLGPPRRSMSVTGLPVLNDAGKPAGAVAIIEDTTERRHLEAARRDFVANVSHELKTPVGALGLLAETLMVEKDPVVMERLIQRMHVETVRVGQVIDDLLNLSRIESLRHVSAELVSAKGVVDQAISRVRYAAEHRSIGIGIHGDLDATLYGGQRELVSAVHHLLENALKYSNENSSVEVGIAADGDWTEISVRDHGMGIAAQYLDRIFERFYRVDDARTRSTGGTGLGLSIVRHVVQSHGGEVRVTSQEGDGSTFTLRLASKQSAATERLVIEGGTDG